MQNNDVNDEKKKSPQTRINRLQTLRAGVWPSCLGKSIVLTLELCHCALHWQRRERFIPLRLILKSVISAGLLPSIPLQPPRPLFFFSMGLILIRNAI